MTPHLLPSLNTIPLVQVRITLLPTVSYSLLTHNSDDTSTQWKTQKYPRSQPVKFTSYLSTDIRMAKSGQYYINLNLSIFKPQKQGTYEKA